MKKKEKCGKRMKDKEKCGKSLYLDLSQFIDFYKTSLTGHF